MIVPLAATAAAAATLVWGAYDPASPLFGAVLGHGPVSRRALYLTFDDGPRPSATEPILDILAREDIPAAFFLVGAAVRRHPTTARRVVAGGHEIGNHTRHHRKLHRLGPRRIHAELGGAHQDLLDVTGVAPRAFRSDSHALRENHLSPIHP